MVTIEIEGGKRLTHERAGVLVDGSLIPGAYAHGGLPALSIYCDTPEASAVFEKLHLDDLPTNVRSILLAAGLEMEAHPEIFGYFRVERPLINGREAIDELVVDCQVSYLPGKWRQPWTMLEFRNEVFRLAPSVGLRDSFAYIDEPVYGEEALAMEEDEEVEIPHFGLLATDAELAHLSIGEQVARLSSRVSEVLDLAKDSLVRALQGDAVVRLFDFPPDVRVPCEQYLLFFVDFLRGLGLEVESDLSHDAGKTLFSVTPKDGREALELIHEALEEYLQMPHAATADTLATFESDPRVQQLVANIHHLRGQLTLSNAIALQKDATIAALATVNAALSASQVGPDVFGKSARLIGGGDEGNEVIADGLVTLKPYEAPGMSINVPEAYRRLLDKVREFRSRRG